jgi:uncharacterized protein YhfF
MGEGYLEDNLMNKKQIQAYWQRYLDTLPAEAPARQGGYVVDTFGDSPQLADELGALIVAGTKTATCSALWEWQAEGEPLPEVGLISIVLDGSGEPLCIIETTQVQVLPFDQVDARFAYEEGEGDRSLAYWREAHCRFFTRTLDAIGRKPAEDMPLVCERFQLVYRE